MVWVSVPGVTSAVTRGTLSLDASQGAVEEDVLDLQVEEAQGGGAGRSHAQLRGPRGQVEGARHLRTGGGDLNLLVLPVRPRHVDRDGSAGAVRSQREGDLDRGLAG